MQRNKPGKGRQRKKDGKCKKREKREGHQKNFPVGAWMFVLCVINTDKRQHAGQSKQGNKYR
jgi:hypothetical protein